MQIDRLEAALAEAHTAAALLPPGDDRGAVTSAIGAMSVTDEVNGWNSTAFIDEVNRLCDLTLQWQMVTPEPRTS